MATLHPRLNITFDPEKTAILMELAKKNHRSVSAIAKELILEALERREDIALSVLAEKRDSPRRKKIRHQDAWK
jgi:predicted DNA-binding protein